MSASRCLKAEMFVVTSPLPLSEEEETEEEEGREEENTGAVCECVSVEGADERSDFSWTFRMNSDEERVEEEESGGFGGMFSVGFLSIF